MWVPVTLTRRDFPQLCQVALSEHSLAGRREVTSPHMSTQNEAISVACRFGEGTQAPYPTECNQKRSKSNLSRLFLRRLPWLVLMPSGDVHLPAAFAGVPDFETDVPGPGPDEIDRFSLIFLFSP